MRNKIFLLLILLILLISIQSITILPWWTFTVLMFLLGVGIPLRKWKNPSFLIGFISSFLSWIIPQLYFESIYQGEIMNIVSEIVNLPYFVVLIGIGLIGGVLGGLGFYSGSELRKGKEELRL